MSAFDAIIFLVAGVIAVLCIKVFTLPRLNDKTIAQLALTVGFAISSQAAVGVIPIPSGLPAEVGAVIAVIKTIAVFALAVTATVMLAISGGVVFSIIGALATIFLCIVTYQNLPPDVQAVLNGVWQRGLAQWRSYAGQ